MADFEAERDAALLSLDRDKLLAFMRKYHKPSVVAELAQATDWAFWAGIHKARARLETLPDVERELSREWLRTHGSRV